MKAKSATTILHHGLWLAAILGLLSCGSARAVLYWEALTNNGTAVFEGLEQSPGIIGVASDPLGEFGNVYRYHLTDTYTSGKERCESRGTRTNGVNFRVQYNQAYYIGWRALWTPMPVNPGWVCLFQMHGYGVTGQGAPMTLRCVNNDGFLWAQANANGTNVDFLHMPFKTNVWQTFVVHTFLSTNFTQGYFEVWYNGVLQTNIYGTTRFYGPTWNNVDGNWQDSYNLFKWGCYRSGAMDGKGDGIAYMSDAKIGSTYADVAPGSGGNPDFSLSASPGSLTIIQGNNGTSTITVNPVNGYNGTVSLSASGLPSGVTASFNPSSTTTSSTLTLSASSTAATGTATITITGADGTLTRTTTVALTVNPPSNLPPGWTDADIGSPAIAGYASDSSGTFTVSGSGSDIWGTSDQFNYAYQSVSGDQTVIARLASENGTATYAKAGVMIRETTAADAVEASVLLTPANGVAMQVRPATGAASINMTGWITGVVPPQWVKIVRSGSTFTGYYSADGSTWTQIASTNVTMATSATAGLAVTSHDTASANTATFDNVSISGSSPPPDFSLSASPGSLTIVQGNNGTSTITINPVNGYNGTVSLSASGLPSGVTASFNPSSTTTSSTLTLTASSTAATGTATVTITGTDGTLTHTTTISLTVNPAPDFSITATPSSQTVTAGNGTSYTTTIGSLNGFSGTVSLSVGGLPSNASASFNPASVTGSGNSTLTVNTTTSTPSGTYTLTITGTSGSLTHSTTVSLTVNPAPDFSLSASPTSLTITQGNNGTSTITVNPINGYSGTVSLSVSGLPSGVTASFNPASTTSSSTLTLTASSTATTGTATVTITGTDGTLTHTTTISLTVNPASGLPAGWTDADIGSVGLAGSASYSGGTFTVSGSGSDIWGTVDAFNYAYQSVSGDQTIVARVVSVQNTSSWAKSGIMVRASTSANDTYVAVYVTPGNGVSMQYRNGTGTSAVDLGRQTGLTAPYWVKIVRSGNTFTGYSSPDGSTWTQVGSISVTMASGVDAGLAVCAHNNTALNTSTFDNVSITGPAPDFSLSASPTSLTITQGGNGTSTITINPVNGYSGTVSLSASGLPSGVTASFNPSSTTTSSTLTLTASSTAATGTATVTITGTDGTLTHTTTISLTVNATVNFSGIYQIQNEASGLVLNNQGKLTNGSPITQWTSVASSNLDWQFFPTSNGYYQINSCKSALDAVVQSASTAAGAGIVQWSFGSSGDDQWQPQLNGDGSYTFVNLHSGLVLGDPGSSTSTSTQMDQETATGGSNQKWTLLLQ